MKKLIHISFIYAIAALVSGVFYREFTKLNGYTGRTALSVTHLHLFVLGTLLFLILALFSLNTDFIKQKLFRPFLLLYNISLPFMVVMFYVRGIFTVLGTDLGKGANAAISGIAGVSHILMAISIVLLFLCLKKCRPESPHL